MADILSMRRLLGFKDFFPNEKPRLKDYYAKKIGKETIEKSTSFFLSFLRHKGNPEVEPLLREWFTFYDFKYYQSPYYIAIEGEYNRIKNYHPNEHHALISVESLLDMFLWSKDKIEIPDTLNNDDVSVTLPFLELILLFNDDVLKRYEKATTSINQFKDSKRIQRLILAGSFSQSDLINVDYAQLFFTQVFKKAKLLSYLEKEARYSKLLNRLLIEFKCDSKEEFLKAVGSAIILPLKTKEPSWSVLSLVGTPDREKSTAILENLAVSESTLINQEQDDYILLRNKPFHKIAEGEYRVIFELFLIKKLYNGLIFKLSSYDENFLGDIRDDFSEGVLVYETLTAILNSCDSIMITGNKFKQIFKLKREPDFYCRDKNNILLFESKDFFMPGKSKLSYDFKIIESELMKDGRLKKAVTQLVTNIGRCFKKEFPDKAYQANEILVYPVIIVHDSLYSCPALNYWVYYWFIEELEKLKTNPEYKEFDFNNIVPLTVIEIDTLILYQNQFVQKEIDLASLIRAYQSHVRFDLAGKLPAHLVEKHALQSAISFSEFVREYVLKKGIQINFETIIEMLKEYNIS